MAGLGVVWVAPSVTTLALSAEQAQATSPVTNTTRPGEGSTSESPTTTNQGNESSTSADVGSGSSTTAPGSEPSTTAGGGSGSSTTPTVDAGSSTTAGGGSGSSTTPSVDSGSSTTAGVGSGSSTTAGGRSTPSTSSTDDEVKDEVIASDLPFTGLPLEQLLPLAGGAIATGAMAVRAARDRKPETPENAPAHPDEV